MAEIDDQEPLAPVDQVRYSKSLELTRQLDRAFGDGLISSQQWTRGRGQLREFDKYTPEEARDIILQPMREWLDTLAHEGQSQDRDLSR